MARKKNAKVADTQLTKPQTRLERYLGTIAGLFSDAPTDPRTRLERYLDAIVQGGGGGGGGGTNPTGTVIYFAGTAAPDGYLVCDGTTYNITDHPDLAQFFADNYGSANYWGGDGITTFAVPDWRGEFFRASGTNSHAQQGSGASVGVHQDATQAPKFFASSSDTSDPGAAGFNVNPAFNAWMSVNAPDSVVFTRTGRIELNGSYRAAADNDTAVYTSRPTNTSLLVCIKA